MAYFKTRGIVLKTYDLGEADKILHIYTDTEGKVKAVAKGLRRPNSRWGGRLEPFSYVSLVLYEGKNLATVTQAETITSFLKIRESLDKLTYGSAMLDLVDKVSVEEKDVKLFHLLLTALETLTKASDKNLKLLLAAFDMKLTSLVGYTPNFLSCSHCGITGFEKKFFSFEWGGILCERCSQEDLAALHISSKVLDILEMFLNSEYEQVLKLEVSKKQEKEILNFVRMYIDYFLQVRLKSREYIAKADAS